MSDMLPELHSASDSVTAYCEHKRERQFHSEACSLLIESIDQYELAPKAHPARARDHLVLRVMGASVSVANEGHVHPLFGQSPSVLLPESHMLSEAPQLHDAPFIDFC